MDYSLLKKLGNDFQPVDELSASLNLPLATVASVISQLESEGLAEVKRETKTICQLTPEGKSAVSELPERALVNALVREEELSSLFSRTKLDSIALQWAKKNNWIMLLSSGGKTLVKKLPDSNTASKHESLLAKLVVNSEIDQNDLPAAKELAGRKLAKLFEQKQLYIKITPKGKLFLKQDKPSQELVNQVTPAMVKQGTNAIFRPYDVEANVEQIYPGKKHPLQIMADRMRDILAGMGFEEMDGPIVESSFWNFDVMFMAQNHPNRDMMDTFFLKQPSQAKVEPKLADIVKQVHINGWSTGSKGCASQWNIAEAAKPILRTHTTSTTFRYLNKIGKGEIKSPGRFFSIAKVFRNEAIDRTHLPEFHQIEGFVAADGQNLRTLMGVFTDFYKELGISKIRFKPVFNPYTEPSMEIFGYHDVLSKWVEIGNSGIFRPETLAPFGIKQNVLGWGLALERAAMIIFGVDDIRKVVGASTDLQWVRDFPELPEVLR